MSTTVEEIKKEIDKGFDDIKKTHEEYKLKYEQAKLENDDTKKLAKEAADRLTDLQKHVNDLDVLLQKKNQEEGKHQTGAEKLKGIFLEHESQLQQLFSIDKKEGQGQGTKYVMKAPADILIGTNYTGGILGISTRDPEITRPARLTPMLRQIFRTIPVTSQYVYWVELINRDGGAAAVAEGAVKPRMDFDYQEQNKKTETIAVWTKASKQALADIPQLAANANQELVESVDLEFDRELYAGTGVSPEIRGIKTYAPTVVFTGSAFATAVVTPNRADVIMAVIALQTSNYFPPTHVLVNPQDYALMLMDKDTQGNSLNRPYITPNGTIFVGGVQLVPTMQVPLGEFLVGDFTKATIGIREDISIQVSDNVNDDFIRNMMTILAEMRAVMYVKSNHIAAFAKGTYAAALTAITKP